ncbi:tetratricopeptide repeat protein [uncultured Bradyrhizobium sp.]|uniref:tetratricopeptide repeat protein n=1 Tax=uncultured Bradyrhizobium sp. TaxID=199684 RepID=UPI0035C9C90C
MPKIGKERSFIFTFRYREEIKLCEEEQKTSSCDRLIQEGQFDKSETAAIYFRLGNIFAKYGNQKSAIPNYNEAIRRTPLPEYLSARAASHEASFDYDRAISDYTQLIGPRNSDPNTLLKRGTAFYRSARQDRFQSAIKDFDSAEGAGIAPAQLYFFRGAAKYNLERYAAAIPDMSRAITLGGTTSTVDKFECYRIRGHSYYKEGNFKKAIDDLTTAERLVKKDASKLQAIYALRAPAYNSNREYALAVADYDRAIRLSPASSNTYLLHAGMATAYLNMEKLEDAIGSYTASLSQKESAEIYFSRAETYMKLRKYKDARSDYAAVIKLDGQNLNALRGHANASMKLDDFPTAIKWLEAAIAIAPKNVDLLVALGNAYLHENLVDNAQATFKKASVLSLMHPGVVSGLTEIARLATNSKESFSLPSPPPDTKTNPSLQPPSVGTPVTAIPSPEPALPPVVPPTPAKPGLSGPTEKLPEDRPPVMKESDQASSLDKVRQAVLGLFANWRYEWLVAKINGK